MKEFSEMSLKELFILQRQLGKAIEKRVKIREKLIRTESELNEKKTNRPM